jgi:hypothetical protein
MLNERVIKQAINEKECERKWSWPNVGTIPEFTWRD